MRESARRRISQARNCVLIFRIAMRHGKPVNTRFLGMIVEDLSKIILPEFRDIVHTIQEALLRVRRMAEDRVMTDDVSDGQWGPVMPGREEDPDSQESGDEGNTTGDDDKTEDEDQTEAARTHARDTAEAQEDEHATETEDEVKVEEMME